MGYSALVIANYFIEKADQENSPITPMKLIKIVYFAHGWNLALREEPLIFEPVEAWQYGPVIEAIYNFYKKFGNDRITELATIDNDQYRTLKQDETTVKILDKIWDVYSGYSAIQLSNMTHEHDSPWSIAWFQRGGRERNHYEIDNCLIQDYFADKVNNKS